MSSHAGASHFSIFPKAPDTARTSSSGGGSSALDRGSLPLQQKRPKSANPSLHANPAKRGLKYKNQNILLADDNIEQFAAYAPSNNNHMNNNKEYNNNDNLMPREDILGNLHEAKKKIKSLENELSQQRAENQRLAMEMGKQQKRLEKVLSGGSNHHINSNNGRSNPVMMEVFKEVEKSSLVRHLKQELSTVKDRLIEKENELETISKTNKGIHIMELKAENSECLHEIARQKAIINRQVEEIVSLKRRLVAGVQGTGSGNNSGMGDLEKSELRKEINRLASGYESILSGYFSGGNTKLSSLHYSSNAINSGPTGNAINSSSASNGYNAALDDGHAAEDRDSCTVRDEEQEGDADVHIGSGSSSSHSAISSPTTKLFTKGGKSSSKKGSKKKSGKGKSSVTSAGSKADDAAELLNCFNYEEATRDEGIRMKENIAARSDYDFADLGDDDDDEDDDDSNNNNDDGNDGVVVGGGEREEIMRRLMADIDTGNDVARFSSTDNYEDDFDDFDD